VSNNIINKVYIVIGSLFAYLFHSENRVTYSSIARELRVSPLRVYRLAHGIRAKNDRDYQILRILRKHLIIEKIIKK
jgi:hypothetical protein